MRHHMHFGMLVVLWVGWKRLGRDWGWFEEGDNVGFELRRREVGGGCVT